MSGWLDQIKSGIATHLSKTYKDAKVKAPKEEWAEFEAWFWKIRPHLNVDWSIYNPPSKAETSGLTLPANPIVPVNENV